MSVSASGAAAENPTRQKTDLPRGIHAIWRARSENQPAGPLLDRVLRARGFEDDDNTRRYLEPSLHHLHDPSLIPDLDKAARRILDALEAREPIVIYGDYDVDGTTACAILYHTLKELEPQAPLSTYLPHRLEEGYGLNPEAIRSLAKNGARVIVSVDCGITATAEAELAKDLAIDLIITDHHNPPKTLDDLPDAFAVVHPRRPDSKYPFGELCGAGVAYKLAWRLCTMHANSERVDERMRTLLVELLALAALGTIADVVPLIDENRSIARFGLRRIKHSPIAGLRQLVEASGLSGDNVSEEDVGFRLAPRLNACGRLGHAGETLELLTTATGERAQEIGELLTRQNDERRRIERRILQQALEQADRLGMTTETSRSILLAGDSWHPGVVGIVCSRLVERHCMPTILLCRDGEILRGSGRSVPGFSLHGALSECEDLLETFGGHDYAVGLSLRPDHLSELQARFAKIALRELAGRECVPEIEYDCDADIGELNIESLAELARLEPFGRGNPRVLVRINGVTMARDATPFGATGDHLSLYLPQGDRQIRVVAWRMGGLATELRRGVRADLLVEPAISTWNGRSRVEPRLEDLRILS